MEKKEFVREFLKNSIDEKVLKDCWNEYDSDRHIYEMSRDEFLEFCDDESYDAYDVLDECSDLDTRDSYFWKDRYTIESFDNVTDAIELDTEDDFVDWFMSYEIEKYIDNSDLAEAFLEEYNAWSGEETDMETLREWLEHSYSTLVGEDWDEVLYEDFRDYTRRRSTEQIAELKAKVNELTTDLERTREELKRAYAMLADVITGNADNE